MSSPSPTRATDPVLVALARHGRAWKTGDQHLIDEAKKELTAAKLRRSVERALATFPPLNEDQKMSIATLLLRGGSA